MFSLTPCRNGLSVRFLLLWVCFGLLAGLSSTIQAQISITLPSNIEAAIQQKLAGSGVTISNVKMERLSGVSQVAIFNNGTENTGAKPNIGIESGIVLSTGDTSSLAWQTKDAYGWSIGRSTTEEHDLLKLLNNNAIYINDPVVITFDLVPTTNNITIDFAFGSDEYEHFVGDQNYIDAYGFFISGPGINGTFTNNAVNVAQFPNGDPVSTNYVNRNKNSAYYVRNPDVTFYGDWISNPERGNHVALNGWTKVITSHLPAEAGQTYKVKIALGDGGDGQYDSSVFIGQFKSERQLAGRVFQYSAGTINEQALAEGDDAYQYFPDARVVLFDRGGAPIQETRTGPRGEYRFTVEKQKNYQIAVDASTLTDSDDYPEQTWSSLGGQCTNGADGIRTLEQSGYCYGGKLGGVQDKLHKKKSRESAEHLIIVNAGYDSNPHLNFGFSYDVVTHSGEHQGSLRSFINNANKGVGTGQMLFIPVVPTNSGKGWKITVAKNGALSALTRDGTTLDGRGWNLLHPEQPVYSGKSLIPGMNTMGQTPALELTTRYTNSPLLTLNGANQSVIYTALTDDNKLLKSLIQVSDNCRNCTITNNLIANNRGPGIVVTNSSGGNRISTNYYYRNVADGKEIPIDQGGDGINATTGDGHRLLNQKIDRPIIESFTYDPVTRQLNIAGFVPKDAEVEFYQHTAQGYQFFFEATEGSRDDLASDKGNYKDPVSDRDVTQQRFQFTTRLTGPETSIPELAAIAIDSRGNTSEFSPPTTLSRDATITATVWHDLNGNDEQDGNEPGIANINVQLSLAKSTILPKKISTNQDGKAVFRSLRAGEYKVEVLPDQTALDGLTLGENMENPRVVSISNSGTLYVSFGYVESSVKSEPTTLTPEHSRSTAPGLFVHFPHTLTSAEGGSVTLSAQWLNDSGETKNKTTENWPIKLEKVSCNIEEKRSTENSTSTLELVLKPRESACFQASFFVPSETPQGVRRSLEITATFSEKHTSSGPLVLTVIDQITVTDGGSGRLKLQKWVRNKTEGEGNSTSNTAGSGDTMIYTIQFQNIGAGPLTDLKIIDDTPAFTQLVKKAKCPAASKIPKGLGTCEVETLGPDKNDKGFRGRIVWNFTGTLQPGAKGEVSYELMVE